MATQASLRKAEDEFVGALLAHNDVADRARAIAERAAVIVSGAAAVYSFDAASDGWIAQATAGEIRVPTDVPIHAMTLGVMAESGNITVFAADDLVREHYPHLQLTRTVVGLACVPLYTNGELIGAIEAPAFDELITAAVEERLRDLSTVAAPALAAALEFERERNQTLSSITRLTQLYDIEKVFHSTLEMDDLLKVIPEKIAEVVGTEAINLWMVEEEDRLILTSRAGNDPTVSDRHIQAPGEGIATEVSEAGEPVIVTEEDERLIQRNSLVNAEDSDHRIRGLAAVPLLESGFLVGVIEAVNKLDGTPFDDSDVFFLSNLAEVAGSALHNANMLLAERKVEILKTLVDVSKDITSTLDLERVLTTIVTAPGRVIPYDRAAIALEEGGALDVRAVSGAPRVATDDPSVKSLRGLMSWVASIGREVWVRQRDGVVDSARPEERAKFDEYFASTGYRGFFALPLSDEEGRVGVLSFESSDPDFLNRAHVEMAHVLAAQATVSLRNAQLYREVPFISVLEPLMQKKQKFLGKDKRARRLRVAAIAAIVVLLLLPIPMRINGNATVAPTHRAQVQPEVNGVIRQVLVREGQWVEKGAVLASLADWEARSALAAAEAKYKTATSEMARALANNDGTEAGIQRTNAMYWKAEVDRSRERLDHLQLRAPIAGFVTTQRIEDYAGRRLEAGDLFAEIEDSSRASVDVEVEPSDVSLVRNNADAAVKLNGYPTKTFPGHVALLSPRSTIQSGRSVFTARLDVDNPQHAIRPGMRGRGKISAGWRPTAYVLLRAPVLWAYSTLWSWFGW